MSELKPEILPCFGLVPYAVEHRIKTAPRADSNTSLENIFRLKAIFLPHPYPGRTLATEKPVDGWTARHKCLGKPTDFVWDRLSCSERSLPPKWCGRSLRILVGRVAYSDTSGAGVRNGDSCHLRSVYRPIPNR